MFTNLNLNKKNNQGNLHHKALHMPRSIHKHQVSIGQCNTVIDKGDFSYFLAALCTEYIKKSKEDIKSKETFIVSAVTK